MKLLNLSLILPLLFCLTGPAQAYTRLDCKNRTESMNVLTDVFIIRPVGFAATLAGGAVFLGTSPLTAIASIPEPHNAFDRMYEVLVGGPYVYTFVRPLGYFDNSCQ